MSLHQRLAAVLRPYRRDGYTVLRIGLGLTILLAGIHKLFRPTIWGSYTAPWAVDGLTTLGSTVDTFMRLNGVVEAVLGTAILTDRYTSIAAGLVSLSLLGILLNLASTGLQPLPVFIRDLGLFALALGVTLLASGRGNDR